jgi:hypothetical protein
MSVGAQLELGHRQPPDGRSSGVRGSVSSNFDAVTMAGDDIMEEAAG